MFLWKKEYHWEFSRAGYTDSDSGPAITGAKMFRGGKYLNAVRESAQNGADAKNPDLPTDTPVRMEFELIHVDRSDIPGIDRLAEVIDKGYEYISSIPNAKLDDVKSMKAASDHYLKGMSRIPVLKISDYNTVGLKDDRFEKLLRMEGITNKGDQDSGGSFGFGKYAPFLLSTVNTILYSTLTSDGEFLFQGRSLLATFKDGDIKFKGNSLFGYEDIQNQTFNPINVVEDVPEVFRRESYGTDLYILCFEEASDWIERMAISALENFFYSVSIKKLEFAFRDQMQTVQITSDNLPDMMQKYKDIYEQKYSGEPSFARFTAPDYWKVLNDSRTVEETIDDFRNKGQIKLFILMGEDVEGRSALEMRSLGMKIQEDTSFRRLPSFNAVLIATGAGKESEDYRGNISKFLLKTESPAHNSWSLEDVEIEEIKTEAKAVLNEIHNWIRDCVKKQLPPDDGSPVDAFGLSKVLPDITNPGAEKIEEDAVFRFMPKPITTEVVREKRPSSPKPPLGDENGQGPGPTPGPGPGPGPGPQPGPGPFPGPIPGPGPDPAPKKEKIVAVRLKSITSPYIANKQLYRISFISAIDANPLMLQIKISGDDSSTFEATVIEANCGTQKLTINNGLIMIPNVKRNKKVSCEVKVSETEVCALEVTAYAKK